MSKASSSLLIFLSITLLANHALAQDPSLFTYYLKCYLDSGNYTANGTYHNNLKTVLSALASQATIHPFYNASAGAGEAAAFGQYYCRGDIDYLRCSTCISDGVAYILQGCSPFKSAVLWYEGCTLRYDNQSMVGIYSENFYTYKNSLAMVSDTRFPLVLNQTFARLINDTAYGTDFRRFAVGEQVVSPFLTVYGLTQCSPDLNGTECEACLLLLDEVDPREPVQWMFKMLRSCQKRYGIDGPHYGVQNASPPPPFPSSSPSLSPPPPFETPLTPFETPPVPFETPPTPIVTGGSMNVRCRLSMKLRFVVIALALIIFEVNTSN